MAVWSAITRITTFDVGVTPAVGQSGDPHRQARTSLLSAIAPAASERRSPALRGSSAHNPLTIAATRCLQHRGGRGQQLPEHRHGVGVVITRPDDEVAAPHRGLGAPLRVGVKTGHLRLHRDAQLLLGEAFPS